MYQSMVSNRKVHPRQKANLLSFITFAYIYPLLWKACKNDLNENDMFEVATDCESKKCGEKMDKQIRLMLRKTGRISWFRLLLKLFGLSYLILGFTFLIVSVSYSCIYPSLQSRLISSFENENEKKNRWSLAAQIIILRWLFCWYMNNYFIIFDQICIRIRTSITSAIYRKILRISPAELSTLNLGTVTTLVTKDMFIVEFCAGFINLIVVGLFETIILCFLLFNKLGKPSLIGIFILLLVTPLQAYLASFVRELRTKVNKCSDERLQATKESFTAIRLIKMYTWERFFQQKINTKRNSEMKTLFKTFLLNVFVYSVGLLGSNFALYIMILSYIWLGYPTTAELIYYIFGIFGILRMSLNVRIPNGILRFSELKGSLSRIKALLEAPELSSELTKSSKPKIIVKNLSLILNDKTLLDNISFNLSQGLNVVTGKVGSSKTILLKTIMKEYIASKGDIEVEGTISYASQNPWLFPASIKQNILLDKKFDKIKYQNVIRACALEYDFKMLQKGDETILTDNGVNLSKGQQARINLARCTYQDSDIYLIDDALNALDENVQNYVFEHCIKSYLKNKICVLVTQNPKHIREANNVIYLENGKIGPHKGIFKLEEIKNSIEQGKVNNPASKSTSEISSLIEENEQIISREIYFETKKEGVVSFDVYKSYIKLGGLLSFGIVLLSFVSAQITDSFSQKLLSNWVDLTHNVLNYNRSSQNSTYEELSNDRDKTFTYYSVNAITSLILLFGNSYLIRNFGRVASINLHKKMVLALINSEMNFFDTHFLGNILNRFSFDLINIDEYLPDSLSSCLFVLFSIIGSLSLIVSVNWKFIFPIVIYACLLMSCRFFYIPSARCLMRLEAATRSPMIGHISASFEGVTTIRSSRSEEVFIETFDKYHNLYTSCHLSMFCAKEGFGFLMDIVSLTYKSVIISLLLIFDNVLTAGAVGLVLNEAFTLASNIQWGTTEWTNMESQLTSLERALEYTKIKQENKSGKSIRDFPKKGEIVFDNVNMAYSRKGEKILNNLSFKIEGGQKIGIIGRTGSGKSSIVTILLKLYDFEGNISIDNRDLRIIPIEYLRQNISVIPQDPILITATLRENIDPLYEYSDQDVWNALEKVHIKKLFESLNVDINTNSVNLSVGQKQLICIARALIRKCKIIVLDEITASMDYETGKMLQDVVQSNFESSTVLIIAHRLDSIIDTDKIMVLDKGRIIEFDYTQNLLQRESSIFYKMRQSQLA